MDYRGLAAVVVLVAAGWGGAQAAVDPAQASYDTAFGLTRAHSFDQAELAWQSFLRQYPDHPLDGSAQYFLGETYFGRNDYHRAAAAFAAGIERYPRGDLAVETLLKLGIALGRGGQTGAACDAFARLDRDFPATTGVARERALVEKRQYRCPEPATAAVIPASLPAGDAVAKPAVAMASDPAPAAPIVPPQAVTAASPPPAVAAPPATASVAALGPHLGSDGEPAPPAQPVIPVERRKLQATDAEREAARAELYVTPPPVSTRAARSSRTAAAAAPATGDNIKTTQILLAALDYDVGPPNGQMGPRLREAVRAFETKDGMRTDGEVSDRLVQRLSVALVGRKTAAPAAAMHRIAGTGFIVSRSGYVITALHLVDGCPDIRVRTLGSDGATTPVVATDPENDLALLRLKTPADAAVKFRDGRGPRQGDGIVVSGLAASDGGASDFYLAAGTVSALSGARNEPGIIKISAPVAAERGSAPVFDRTGQVIGLLGGAPSRKAGSGTAVQDGVALRATIARNFLDAHDVDYESASAGGELKAAEIGDLAKEVVVQVECRR